MIPIVSMKAYSSSSQLSPVMVVIVMIMSVNIAEGFTIKSRSSVPNIGTQHHYRKLNNLKAGGRRMLIPTDFKFYMILLL